MVSLPVVWITVGGVLFVLSLVMGVLFALKSREVATLKKQCEDLRDTMRMMRYEEANLARMLHTANKSMPQSEVTLEQEVTTQTESLVSAIPFDENDVEEPVSEVSDEPLPIVSATDAEEKVETPALDSESECCEIQEALFASKDVEEDIEEEVLLEVEETKDSAEDSTVLMEEFQPTTAQPHKQPINERRPAIPADLFAAWFAENDENETLQEETHVVASAETMEETHVEENANFEGVVVEDINSQEVLAVHEEIQDAKSIHEIELSKDDERFCRKLERVVSTRLRNPNLNIDIIAAQFGIGRTNFYRKVRELTGMSPNDYLRKCRMERAAELLDGTEEPINEVCAQVGIPDAQYFSRVFKAHYGVSPSVYREKNNQ
jgi:AraC-like DNA-binding protein